MRLFDFSLKINGFDIYKAKSTLSKIQAKNDSEYKAYIEHQKKKIISYHLEHNSFYKAFGNAIDIDAWGSIPIMTKRHLQQPIQQRLSENFNPKNAYLNKTSGSSGDPFLFAKDKWCHAMTWAEIMSRFSWYGIDFNSSKQARFYGIPLDKKEYYKERLKDWFSNRFRFSVFGFRFSVLNFRVSFTTPYRLARSGYGLRYRPKKGPRSSRGTDNPPKPKLTALEHGNSPVT